jgi:hypothetical protein
VVNQVGRSHAQKACAPGSYATSKPIEPHDARIDVTGRASLRTSALVIIGISVPLWMSMIKMIF